MTFFNFARFLPVFLLKKRPFFARFFIKLSPFEELVTLQMCLLLPIDLCPHLNQPPWRVGHGGATLTTPLGAGLKNFNVIFLKNATYLIFV